MKKPYRLVVFDWEGTLGDTLGQVLSTIEKEASLLNIGVFDKDIANNYISFGLVKVIKKLYPQLSVSTQGKLLNSVEKALMANPRKVYLVTDAAWFVKLLYSRGFILALASNKGQQSLQKDLQVSDLQEYFSIIRTASQTAPKPRPDMLLEILKEANVDSSEVLMIGDSVTDIEMAQAIKVDAVGVDFYHRDKEMLRNAGAIQVFDSYRQLASFLHLGEK